MLHPIPINPASTAPEDTDIIVIVQPSAVAHTPLMVRTFRCYGKWADIPRHNQNDVVGWIHIEDARKLIKGISDEQ